MQSSHENDEPVAGEVVEGDAPNIAAGSDYYLAQIANYTERPDLLIAEIEKHDSGFVKRMNERSEEIAEQTREARFKFSERQAYLTLGLQGIAALAVLALAFVIALTRDDVFWPLVALIAFYAVSQGGRNGFISVIGMLGDFFKRGSRSD